MANLNIPKAYDPETERYHDVPVFDPETNRVTPGKIMVLGEEGTQRAVSFPPIKPHQPHVEWPNGRPERATPDELTHSA